MDVNMTSSNNTFNQSKLSQNIDQTKQQFRRRLMILSRRVRELKETTGTEATILIATKDKKLYCVMGQHRLQDMRARAYEMNISAYQIEELESETLDQGVDEDKSLCRFNRPLDTMGDDELEQFKLSLLKLKKDVGEAITAKPGAAAGSYDPPARSSWELSPTPGLLHETSSNATTAEAAGDSGGLSADRDGSATASASYGCQSGLGQRAIKSAL